MKEELKYNLTNYLITNTKKQKVITILVGLTLLILFLFSMLFKIDDIEIKNALTVCIEQNCTLKFYDNKVKNVKYDFVKVKESKYRINQIEFAEPSLDSTNGLVQEVTLKLKKYQGINNEIVEIKLYKNKEKLLKKIVKMIVER